MVADGFGVDLPALRAAAEGVRATVEQVAVGAIPPVGAAAGAIGAIGAIDLALNAAVANPEEDPQFDPCRQTYRYKGRDAVVVLNEAN